MSRRTGKRGASLVVIIVLFVLSGAIMAGGYFGARGLLGNVFKDIEVDVDFDDDDVESAYEKFNFEYDEDTPSLNDLMNGHFIYASSTQDVDVSLTNEEITALFDDLSDKDDFIQDVRFQALDDDEFEMSFTLDNLDDMMDSIDESGGDIEALEELIDSFSDMVEGETIYYTGSLEYDEDGFNTDFGGMRVGSIPVPASAGDEAVDLINDYLNQMQESVGGMDIENLEITEDGIDFIGTIPTDIDTKND